MRLVNWALILQWVVTLGCLGIPLFLLLLWWIGSRLEQFVNRVDKRQTLPPISPAAQALHNASLIADLHTDALMLGRDLLTRSDTGHVDLPRLQAGNVALQVFAVATVIPLGFNIDNTPDDTLDLLTLAGLIQRSPTVWMESLQRALWQAERLRAMAERSQASAQEPRLRLMTKLEDLDNLLAARAAGEAEIGGILAIEGAQAVGREVANLQLLYNAGYRILGLSHFHDNIYAASAHGQTKAGLSPRGRILVQKAWELGMLVDVSHLAPKGIAELVEMHPPPLISSHTGAKGMVNNLRNLSDGELKGIAATGGVVGIGYWEEAVGGNRPEQIIDTIEYVLNLIGDDHVALGSDFDGGIRPAFDTSQISVLTETMLQRNLPEESLRKILGGNGLRVVRHCLAAVGANS